MRQALKAEVRKLFTVRSTYILIGISLVMIMLLAGYVDGVRTATGNLTNPELLMSESRSAVALVGLLMAIAGMLLVGHEYRYNTIMYTLTSANKRLKPLASKVIVITVFSVLMGLFITFFSPFCTIIGLKLGGHHLVAQHFYFVSIIWRCVFCVWGYAMYGLILATLIRSQIGAIVTYLLIPIIAENILGALLKEHVRFLPFTGLQSVVSPGIVHGATSGAGAVVASTYIVVGFAVSAFLFVRRDAN